MTLWTIGPYQDILWCPVRSLCDLCHTGHGCRVVLWGGGTSGRGGVVSLEPWYGLSREPLLVVVEYLVVV